jgi:hypothetical protein
MMVITRAFKSFTIGCRFRTSKAQWYKHPL